MSIVLENISYTYMKGSPFERTALRNINVRIDAGEFVGIIGHTGSGKTTLIQHFNGLLKPTSGRIIINGVDVAEKNLRELRQQVGIVFQYPEYQLFEETVYKDIAFGLEKMGLSAEEKEKRVNEVIEIVGLKSELLDKSPFELSGGQKRRVAIAGVLVMKPNILVLDEPTAGLDPYGKNEVFKFISQMHKENKLTIILVTHSMEDVVKLADRVMVMNKGTIEIVDKPDKIFSKLSMLKAIGLDAPQITHFMKKLKEFIPEANDNIYTVDDAKREILKLIKRN